LAGEPPAERFPTVGVGPGARRGWGRGGGRSAEAEASGCGAARWGPHRFRGGWGNGGQAATGSVGLTRPRYQWRAGGRAGLPGNPTPPQNVFSAIDTSAGMVGPVFAGNHGTSAQGPTSREGGGGGRREPLPPPGGAGAREGRGLGCVGGGWAWLGMGPPGRFFVEANWWSGWGPQPEVGATLARRNSRGQSHDPGFRAA